MKKQYVSSCILGFGGYLSGRNSTIGAEKALQRKIKMPKDNSSETGYKPYGNMMYATSDVAGFAGVSGADLEAYAREHFADLQHKPRVKRFTGEKQAPTARFLWPDGSLEEIKALRISGQIAPAGGAVEEYDPALHDALFDAKKGLGLGVTQ